ncbi:hypothetical protein OHS70_00650 [Streptomyces sp. NBC_00390]|uniref:effector-associated constant component EACC1 n=1 Tax=Streptomyces sp. NBC_00390 TaxID=2975736 RepID=UPI002E23B501
MERATSEVTIVLAEDSPVGERDGTPLFELRHRLTGDEDLRGRLHVVARPPEAGTLGVPADVLTLLVEPGGAMVVVAGVLVAWLRSRRSTVRLVVRRRNGDSVTLSADHVTELNGEQLRKFLGEIADTLESPAIRPSAVENAGEDDGTTPGH